VFAPSIFSYRQVVTEYEAPTPFPGIELVSAKKIVSIVEGLLVTNTEDSS
jgi:hypothetical protein